MTNADGVFGPFLSLRALRAKFYCAATATARFIVATVVQRWRGAALQILRRYQRSRRGRFAHAERSRRYRLRRKNVTHQGSPAPEPAGLLPVPRRLPRIALPSSLSRRRTTAWHGHRCGRRCAAFVRLFPAPSRSHAIL